MKSGGENTYLINSEPPELCVAQLRNGQLFDLYIERGGRLLGDIFRGRVENVLPGMDAAFVNIGLNRNALLYAGDCVSTRQSTLSGENASISELLKVGDEVLVQVAKPPIGTKGARVTMQLSLAGRFAVLSAHSEGVGVSRRIESEDERNRLRRIAEKVRPLDHSLIIRTEGEHVSESDITRDVQELITQMRAIRERAAQSAIPSSVHREMGLLGRLVRDQFGQNTQQVLIDAPEIYESVVRLASFIAPQVVERIRLYNENQPLFQKFKIERELARARDRTVQLPSGGSLVIDEAEALCAIDVNTAKFTGKKRLAETVVQTNLEAVEEAARQVRLRDIGGVIVIDFIDMERRRDSVKVLDALEAALRQDRARTRIVQLSPSGLVEIIRRREGQSLKHILQKPCPYCTGTGVVNSPLTTALTARRQIRGIVANSSASVQDAPSSAMEFEVWLHPEAALAFLGSDDEYVQSLEETTRARVTLCVAANEHIETCRVSRLISPSPAWSADEILHLPQDAPLFPVKDPRFVIVKNTLISFRDPSTKTSPNSPLQRPATLQIQRTDKPGDGRWYFRAKVLTSHLNGS